MSVLSLHLSCRISRQYCRPPLSMLISSDNHLVEETRIVRTLIPENMQNKGQKIITLSGHQSPVVYMDTSPLGDQTFPQRQRWGLSKLELSHMYKKTIAFRGSKTTKEGFQRGVPFPDNTTGVLHYHEEPGLPKHSGAVRFRLCNSIEAFSRGRDLEKSFGLPWAVDLYNIAKFPNNRPLRKFLVDEGLVSEDILQDLENLPTINTRNVRWMFALDQTFVCNLQQTQLNFAILTRKSLETAIINQPWSQWNVHRSSNRLSNPYKGHIRIRLEPYDHPKKGPGVVLRVTEVLTPVEIADPDPTTVLPPSTGQLISRISTRTGKIRPWFTKAPYPVLSRNFAWPAPSIT